ncbi:glycine-rich domain-containing protein [Burkholderia cepacia]|uniref:glycine-rich domain-containing protein n=1 Tax=Burkholderia cepacia TaxID=292 RepID=UPI001CF43725|nr:hypothetical protein [Burkholderia cepacia]MCA8075579.1 hypothetical protein [Burkholderia cepacia]
MDYTTSLDSVVHGATGHRMHSDSIAIPTVFSDNDANMLIWSLMKFLDTAGIAGKAFNPDDPDSYSRLYQAMQRLFAPVDSPVFGGNPIKAPGLQASGQVSGVNAANLLFNGSAEFGVAGGWGGGFVGAYNGGSGDGTYFSNPAMINSNSYVGSSPIAVAAGIPLTLSGEIYAAGVTSGIAWFRLVYLNSSNGVISTSANITATNGVGWTFAWSSFVTPANTAFVYVQLGVEAPGPTVSSGGVAWRRLKLERGAAPSLYSQEASIAAVPVHGMQMFQASGAFTVPQNVTRLKATVIGGGASGGGCFSSATYVNAAGGGGGAGGIAIGWFAVTPGQSIPFTVGAGGAAIANGTAAGGASAIPLFGLTANGGFGSTFTSTSSSAGGVGGPASGGQINIRGSSGTDGQNISAFVFGGKGGDGMFGGGGRAGSGSGTAGGAPGAGGGGAYDLAASNTALPGGAGYNGAVIFEW